MLRGLRGKTPASLSLERLPGEGRADAGTLSSGWAEAGPGAFLAGLDAGRQPGLGKPQGLDPLHWKRKRTESPLCPSRSPEWRPHQARQRAWRRGAWACDPFTGPSPQSAPLSSSCPARPTSDGKRVTAQCLELSHSLSSSQQAPLGLRAGGGKALLCRLTVN